MFLLQFHFLSAFFFFYRNYSEKKEFLHKFENDNYAFDFTVLLDTYKFPSHISLPYLLQKEVEHYWAKKKTAKSTAHWRPSYSPALQCKLQNLTPRRDGDLLAAGQVPIENHFVFSTSSSLPPPSPPLNIPPINCQASEQWMTDEEFKASKHALLHQNRASSSLSVSIPEINCHASERWMTDDEYVASKAMMNQSRTSSLSASTQTNHPFPQYNDQPSQQLISYSEAQTHRKHITQGDYMLSRRLQTSHPYYKQDQSQLKNMRQSHQPQGQDTYQNGQYHPHWYGYEQDSHGYDQHQPGHEQHHHEFDQHWHQQY